MKMSAQSQLDVSIKQTMIHCARNISLGLCGVAAFVAIVFAIGIAAPIVINGISMAWYGWAKILTRDYTTLVPAAWVDWIGLMLVAWTLCVAVKLGARKPAASCAFVIAAIVALLFVVIPANCAIAAITMEWTSPVASGHTIFELVAYATAFLVTLVCMVSPLFALFAVI
ncbi:hypothetical protein [Burkholderia cenocepacia]|uniref:hypothetical protein n=1 Tax=Burkholderia cenocepacia TaxID=95486 RepID=UPI002B242E81|nr:hypothetical protein [Burkholderia cenocepacia]MEB2558811.1 hypothetical protein [Burkholderia cenocepacia]